MIVNLNYTPESGLIKNRLQTNEEVETFHVKWKIWKKSCEKQESAVCYVSIRAVHQALMICRMHAV